MNIKNKIIPIALSLFIGVGSLGIANAAIPIDYQAKMASWINNDPNPMPMNMHMNSSSIVNTDISKTNTINTDTSKINTNSNIYNTNTDTVNKRSGSAIKPSQANPNINNELYNKMIQMCNQVDHQQMMQNMTYEQMVEMEKTWHNSVIKQQKQVQQLNTHTPSQNHNFSRSQNSNRGGNNYNCGW